MVRVGGMSYRCHPNANSGQRIFECRLANGKLLQADKKYKVSGWASVNNPVNSKPIWELAAKYLLDKKQL
jgi:sulfur-oxidizing protein SoxB